MEELDRTPRLLESLAQVVEETLEEKCGCDER